MATESWGTCRGRDVMWPPNFGLSRSGLGPLIGELWHFEYFPTWRPSAILNLIKKLIFDHMTVIVVLICVCLLNFIKFGSRVRPPDAHNCRMFNASLLINGRCYGNRIMADMSRTWWDVTTQFASQSVHWYASYGISNNFQHGGRPPFWILKILIFNYVTVVAILTRCCVPNFIKFGSRVRPPDAHNCRMFNAPLATESWWTCRGHDGMWPPKMGLSRSIGKRIMTFLIFSNMAAVRRFEF